MKKGRSLRFPKMFIKKPTWWSNDKTIIELGYHKISWIASVLHINYLPHPSASANKWSACHWQTTIFCPTSSNNCLLGTFVLVHEPNPEMMPKKNFCSTSFGTKLFWYRIKAYWLYLMNSLVARLESCTLRRYGGVFNGGRVGSNFLSYVHLYY